MNKDRNTPPFYVVVLAGLIGFAIVFSLVKLVLPGSSKPPAKAAVVAAQTFTAGGSISVRTDDFRSSVDVVGGDCHGVGGFADMHQGTQVVVMDQTGATLALGQLDAGNYTSTISCKFLFNVSNIPVGKPFYKIEIANRGGLQYTQDELSQPLSLSLGQ
jgi:hypothetical protein